MTVAYRQKPVLWDVEYDAPSARLIAIVGPNGAGKSTLMKACLGMLPLAAGERPVVKRVRFRTMGDYPLTAAHESTATTVPEIIEEMLVTTTSERGGRLIDKDEAGSMEKKKREGYF